MSPPLPGPVQVAGVIDLQEAEMLVHAGADMLGFPLGLKDGREDLSLNEAAHVIEKLAGRATAVCITYFETANDIAALCRRIGAPWVQVHGDISVAELRTLRGQEPHLGIIKSLVVREKGSRGLLQELKALEPWVDAFITDTHDPATGRTGATGLTHDWSVSKQLVGATHLPVILAGGLDANNVGAAIQAVRPAAVDAHTGLESQNGRKDPAKVRLFIHRALAALGVDTQAVD